MADQLGLVGGCPADLQEIPEDRLAALGLCQGRFQGLKLAGAEPLPLAQAMGDPQADAGEGVAQFMGHQAGVLIKRFDRLLVLAL